MSMRQVFVITSFAAAMLTGTVVYAAPIASTAMPVRAMFGSAKTVNFSLRNDSTNELKLQCGEQTVTVDPGKTTKMKVPTGTKLVFLEAFGQRAAGSVLTEAGPQLSGTTLSVR